MSTKGIEEVLSRAMRDSTFAESLFVDPAKALAGFELTAEEIAKFHGISRQGLSATAGTQAELDPTVEESMAPKGEYKNGQKTRVSAVGYKSSSSSN